MTKTVLVPIADGVEEIEAVCIIDVLRRAGAEVTVASLGATTVTASRGVKLMADRTLSDCREQTFDLIALPGGIPGAEHLRDSAELIAMLKTQKSAGRLYGAICASPAVVLQPHGLLDGKQGTCHPSLAAEMDGAVDERVVVDDNCVTSRGPGTALEFALALVERLFGREKAAETAAPMIMPESGQGGFMALIAGRRSIRRFADRPVEKEKQDKLIEAALRAPSSRSICPWAFVVVDDAELLTKLAAAKPHGASFLENAPLGLVVCGETDRSDVWVEDTSIATIFIHLAAAAMGLGSCWIQIRKREHAPGKTAGQYVAEVLDIPDRLSVEAIVAVGYPAESKSPHDRDSLLFDKVSINRYGRTRA